MPGSCVLVRPGSFFCELLRAGANPGPGSGQKKPGVNRVLSELCLYIQPGAPGALVSFNRLPLLCANSSKDTRQLITFVKYTYRYATY